jgi:hypothetical protein
MALKLVQSGREPLGQFDCLDADLPNVKGGEVMIFDNVVAPNPPGTDLAASDSFDGYVNPSGTQKRTVARLMTSALDGYGPSMLSDDGIKGYGTLFGTVVGATVGQKSYGPSSTVAASDLLGPHSAKASGKVTLWDKPGMYAVSLDACDPAVGTGLQPTNQTLGAGAKLYVMNDGTGRLTPPNSAGKLTHVVGRFIEFETNGSLVTTPNKLVAALNSPSGSVSSVGLGKYDFAVFWFDPSAVGT